MKSGLPMQPHKAFAPFTDPAAVRGLLQARVHELVDTPRELLGCEVLHAWRKTYEAASSWDKSYLSVCYRLRFAQPEPSGARAALVHGTAYFRHRGLPAGAAPALTTLHVEGIDLALRRFPDDAALPQLALLTDTARLLEFVPPSVLPELVLVRGVALEVVNYRAGERCTLRYDIALESPPRVLTLFAKSYKDGSGAAVHRHLSELHSRGARSVRVAEPLGYDPATHTVWQKGERGCGAAQALRGAQREPAARALARSLAALHAAKLSYERVSLREQLLFDTRKRASKLAGAYPPIESALQAVMARCARERPLLPAGDGAVLHGDAHVNQFRLAAGEAVMFDFDEITYGDAEHDLANFIISLQMDVPAQALVAAFLQEYRKHSRRHVDAALLLWHYRILLICKAYRAFWRQAPRASRLVAQALDLASEEAPAWL